MGIASDRMCGRFSLACAADQLPLPLRSLLPADHRRHYRSRVLVRPFEPVLSLVQEDGDVKPALMLWGLLPAWVKDPMGVQRPINARSETVGEKPSFRGAWRHRRCLIPATAFFEKRHGFQRSDGSAFWLAGVWERWMGADGSELETCAVLTTTPNALVKPFHPRMPVIIPEGLEQAWIAPVHGDELRALEPLMAPWSCQGWVHVGEVADEGGLGDQRQVIQGSLF